MKATVVVAAKTADSTAHRATDASSVHSGLAQDTL
jgi:hypothetical protein